MTFTARALRRTVPAVALLTLPALHAQAPAADVPLAKLVPEGTAVFIQIPSLEQLGVSAHKVLAAVAPEMADNFDVDDLLGKMDIPGSPKDIDHKKPLAFCLVLGTQPGAQPMPTILVPVVSAESFVKSVADAGVAMKTAVAGSYVVVSASPSATPNATPAAITNGLPTGDVVCRLDMKRLVTAFRPFIDMGLAQAAPAMAAAAAQSSPGMDMTPIMNSYISGFKTFLDSSETLDFALRLDGTRLELATAFTAAEKSALADFGSKEKTDVRTLARFVDPSASMTFATGLDQPAMWKRMKPFLDSVFTSYPEPMRAEFQKMIAGIEPLLADLGSGLSGSADFASDGMHYAMYLHPRDPAKLLELYKSMFASCSFAKLDEMKQSTIDGLQVSRSRLHVDSSKLVPAASAGATGQNGEQIAHMMDAIYGKDGLAFAYATKGDVTAVVLGGDDAFLRSSLARLSTPGAAPAVLARGLEQVGSCNPSFVLHYDLGKVMQWARQIMPANPAMPEIPALDMKLGIWGGIDGRTWRGAMATDVVELGTAVRKMRELETAKPK